MITKEDWQWHRLGGKQVISSLAVVSRAVVATASTNPTQPASRKAHIIMRTTNSYVIPYTNTYTLQTTKKHVATVVQHTTPRKGTA